ncbi:occludin-like isoform X2 [Pleurodeles waltl]|uniref:occludin-like isoform X2 n=1 Tax=Pleurodeles waltl TaxID=8319 RepID=UPI003709764F
MYDKRRYDSPPTYSPPSAYVQSVSYMPPGDPYNVHSPGPGMPPGDPYNVHSPGPGSYYMEDVPQEFYKWKSPPGIVRILQGTVVLLSIAIFACVASTLAWEYNYGMMGMGSMGGYYGSSGYYGGGYYGGSMGGMGYGYNGMTNPQAASGFMMAMAVVCFVAILALFVMSVTKSDGSRSRKFYLIVIIVSAILAFLEAIASIVYIVGVNPRAQMTGSLYYSQMMMMCNQIYSPVGGVGLMNQYLYHYCMVDPQEVKNVGEGTPDDTATLTYSEKPLSPVNAANTINTGSSYKVKENGYFGPTSTASYHNSSSTPTAGDYPARTFSTTTEEKETPSRPAARRGRRKRRNPELDESQYETDYTTAMESGDDRDETEWDSVYPPITTDELRQEYKREFDLDLKHYKQMCAEMDDINDQINQLNKQLDGLSENSLQYQGVAEEYNRLKDLKRTPDYQTKKLETKHLRKKLFHLKRMVGDYDKARG